MKHLNKEQKDSMVAEIRYGLPMLCPDTQSFRIQGDETGEVQLKLLIYPTEKAFEDGILNNSYVYTRDVSHYFNAEFYTEHEYLDAVSLSEEIVYLSPDAIYQVSNFISQKVIDYFGFMWLDTSSLALLKLSSEFSTYHVETS